MNPAQIESALIDVRRSYRLIHDYQRAVLDAVKYVGAHLGLTYRGGYPLFSDCSPRNGKGALENWAWDWLNLVFYDFHFNNDIGKNHFNLSIWVFSDTGFFMSNDPSAEQTDVATFAASESSETKVGFILYREWKDEYNQFHQTKADLRRFIESGQLPTLLSAGGVAGKSFPFSRLTNAESTDMLIDELIQWAKASGFPMELSAKKD